MPHVKYIATCDKQDSIRGIGWRWEPGQVRNVTADVAERLLQHPDTWINVETTAAKEPLGMKLSDVSKEALPMVEGKVEPTDTELGLTPEEKPAEEPLPVVDVHAMNQEEMANYAKTKYNERLDKRQSKETLRLKLTAMIAKHEFDNEGKV